MTEVNTGNANSVSSVEAKVDTLDTVADGIETHAHSTETKTDTIDSLVDGISLNRTRVLQVELDQHTDAGDVTLATVTGSVIIEEVIIKTKTTHADLTSIAVTAGAAKVLELISAAAGAAANLDAEDKQVKSSGEVELGNGKTLVITFAGASNSNHVTMTATIKYRPCTLTGALA